MKICPQCRSQWPDDNMRCQFCGNQLHFVLSDNSRAKTNDQEVSMQRINNLLWQDSTSRSNYADEFQPLAFPQHDANRPVHITVNYYPSRPRNSQYDLATIIGILGAGIIIGAFTLIFAILFLRWLLLTQLY